MCNLSRSLLLGENLIMRFVVIGNGIVALASAFKLSRRIGNDDEIIIIGKNERKNSATRAAGAMLNSFAEIEHGSLDHEIDLYRFELSHSATRLWPQYEIDLLENDKNILPKACRDCTGCEGGGCFKRGTFVINNSATDELEDKNFRAITTALKDFNEPFREVDVIDIPGYRPSPQYRAGRAIEIFDEGWFNPRVMLEKHENILSHQKNVTFVDDYCEKLLTSSGSIHGAQLENGEIVEGDMFLLATGASVSDLLDHSGIDINIPKIFYSVGVSLEIRSPDAPLSQCIRTPNRGLACGLYAVPYFWDPDQPLDHVLLGASNFISSVPVNHGRLVSVQHLLEESINQINMGFDRAELVRYNVGCRPVSQDGYPVLGPTSLGNLVVATGTKRDGFHMAPLIADLTSKWMTGDASSIDDRIKVFAPERDLIFTSTRDASIEKAVEHKMNAAYQHGFKPSYSKMPEVIERAYREDLIALYDAVGAADVGLPIDMLDMYRYGHAKLN